MELTTKLPADFTYLVLAYYVGDANLGSSDYHPPMNYSINVEPSKSALSFVTFDSLNNPAAHSGNISAAYGSPYILRVDVTNASGTRCAGNPPVTTPSIPCPTGTVT